MAIYVFKMKTFSRNAGTRGSRATSAAAYRAGERIRDARTGTSYDHRHRQDVLHKQIVLPRQFAARGAQMDWARNRATLWNAAEQAETRRNARVAREFTLALPHELGQGARVQLAQRFAQDLADRYHNVIDLVIHAPRGDPRNYHAHLLTTTRELTMQGLGRKAALELTGTERYRRGLARWSEERDWLREHWAGLANHALREAGLEVQISHRLPAAPDLTRPPRLPLVAYHIERSGRYSYIAERIRAQHRARLEQAPRDSQQRERLQTAAPAPVAAIEPPASQAGVPGPTGMASDAGHLPAGWQPEQAETEAVRAWQQYRARAAARGAAPAAASAQPDGQHTHDAAAGQELPPTRGNDYDFSL